MCYEFTFSLFIMPLLYGKKKSGIFMYSGLWLINFFTVAWLQIFFKSLVPVSDKLNKMANHAMGYETGWTVSKQLGKRIEEGKGSWVSITHCRILGTYDVSGWHCARLCKGFF